MDKPLRMNIGGSSSDFVSETTVMETLRKHLLTDGVFKFSAAIMMQAKEKCDLIENSDKILRFVKSTCIFVYGVRTLQHYDWKEEQSDN